MQSHRFTTEIWSLEHPKIQIASASWRSLVEQERLDNGYAAFVAELHRRLAAAGAATHFSAGLPVATYWIGAAAFAALMVTTGMLIVRTLQLGQWGTAVIIGGFFVVFAVHSGSYFRRNWPVRYRPDAIPAIVLPKA
jgi:hypothetical protein